MRSSLRCSTAPVARAQCQGDLILFKCRQKSEDSMLFVKSAPLGHLYCEKANISLATHVVGHKRFNSGSFDNAGGLGISTADGF